MRESVRKSPKSDSEVFVPDMIGCAAAAQIQFCEGAGRPQYRMDEEEELKRGNLFFKFLNS
jgi:hypothetical protein